MTSRRLKASSWKSSTVLARSINIPERSMNGAEPLMPIRIARGVVEALNFTMFQPCWLQCCICRVRTRKDDAGRGSASLANVHQKVEDRNDRTPELGVNRAVVGRRCEVQCRGLWRCRRVSGRHEKSYSDPDFSPAKDGLEKCIDHRN